MTDDNTADLTTDEILRMILERLTRLEAQAQTQADERANTTRPLLDRLIQEMIETREMLLERQDQAGAKQDQMAEVLRQIKNQIEVLAINSVEVKAEQRSLAGRVSEIERKVA
jgi:uncharacterized protein (DUF885 family)